MIAVERPREQFNIVKWLRTNLFNTWFNTLLTLVSLVLLYVVLRPLLNWIFSDANWQVVTANLRVFMVGTFPVEQLWRIWLCVGLAATLLGLSWGVWPNVLRGIALIYASVLIFLALLPFSVPSRLILAACGVVIFVGMFLARRAVGVERLNVGRWVAISWLIFLPLVLYLLRGMGLVLPIITPNQWGGLLLTLVLAISGIVFSFPLGVLLAIGRRSSLPAFSLFCTGYIELIRGVPLITVLFMTQVMLPLFIPGGESIDRVLRAIVGFTLFTAAYIAEHVRGGLHAIPRGQHEAAKALGLNPFMTMGMIILPQALRLVIPANVSQFISLFKDTSLVVVASLLDLLGIGKSVLAQQEFLGLQTEVYLFIGAVYWIFAYSLSHVSRRLEETLGVGHR
ncbi:MAG: amino acid ABC transporter permease [Chloroflexales bacterium]|nr:amino acid ABC transporter permease [Chloroflexales bacterium]